MTEKESKESDAREHHLWHAVRVAIFPKGVERLCRRGWEEEFNWYVEILRERLREICERRAIREPGTEDDGHYYCRVEPVPGMPGCLQEVCYNELGEEVHRGQPVCR